MGRPPHELPGSSLVSQLELLSSWENPFQAHAGASLKLLQRRSRWHCRQVVVCVASNLQHSAHENPDDLCNDKATVTSVPVTSSSSGACEEEESLESDDSEIGDAQPFRRQLTAPSAPAAALQTQATQAPEGAQMRRTNSQSLLADHTRSEPWRRRTIVQEVSPIQAHTSTPCLKMSRWLASWPTEVLELLREAPGGDPRNLEKGKEILRLHGAWKQLPHPRKVASGGEDSVFICSKGSALGVADGVSEWEWRFGLNPRAFADELMAGACRAGGTEGLSASARAMAMLEEGFRATRAFGSATALVAALVDGELGVANLGDSGLRVLRWLPETAPRDSEQMQLPGVRVVYRTAEQQHSFNCPYQLCRLPEPTDFARLEAEGFGKLVRAVQKSRTTDHDVPSSANVDSFKVQAGDLILAGSDGVFDNLFDQEICLLIGCMAMAPSHEGTSWRPYPARIANAIALAAQHRSKDGSARTPFGQNAHEAGVHHVGGKVDDISIIAAWVSD